MADPECRWSDAGRVPYGEALEIQAERVRRRLAGEIPDQLIFVEHPHVITLGRGGSREHLLEGAAGIDVVESDRGADVTYHGPGQVVGYPIVDLSPDRRDVHRYVRDLEEVMIRCCADYGIEASRVEGLTGAWVGDDKVGAIGVRIARWVTSHGFALNVSADLSPFDLIVPCGIRGRGVTSLERLLDRAVSVEEVTASLIGHFAAVFERAIGSDALA